MTSTPPSTVAFTSCSLITLTCTNPEVSSPLRHLMKADSDPTAHRYMIHSPYWTDDKSKLQDTWKKMKGVHRPGKARAIGVSNYLRPHIEATLTVASTVPAVNQIEFHPYLQRAKDYVPWLQSKGIQVSGFKPLTPFTAAAGGPLNPVVERISEKHGMSVDSVLLRWQVQKNVIPITTTGKESRLKEYMEAVQCELTEEEVDEMTSVGLTHHFRNWGKSRIEGQVPVLVRYPSCYVHMYGENLHTYQKREDPLISSSITIHQRYP